MDGWVAFHLFSLGVWGGLVLVELMFEVGVARGSFDPKQMARLHVWTDRFAELPLLAMVLLSGLVLWQRAGWSTEFVPKILAGLGAITMNLVCYVVVEQRGRAETVSPSDTRGVFLTAAPGVPMALVALYLGCRHAGWW